MIEIVKLSCCAHGMMRTSFVKFGQEVRNKMDEDWNTRDLTHDRGHQSDLLQASQGAKKLRLKGECTWMSFLLLYSLIPGIPSPAPDSGIRDSTTPHTMQSSLIETNSSSGLEYTDIVADAFLLILCYAFRNPRNVPYFLSTNQSDNLMSIDRVC